MPRALQLSVGGLGLALPLFVLLFSSTAYAHNITHILAKHPEFSTFNHYLTITHLAADINRRLTITVLAVDNAGMSTLLSKHLSVYTIRNVLSLHVLADYFGAKKLHQITDGSTLTSSMYQASGSATGTSGYVNITDYKGGKVGFGAEDNDGHLNAFFVKSVQEVPYNISVIQISQVLTSPEAEAPVAGPGDLNLTVIAAKQGCKAFSDLLVDTGADSTYQANVEGGLTVFCPSDDVIKSFMPKYRNLTAAQKVSLLLFHGFPVYESIQMLKSNNGPINTLATDGSSNYEFTIQNDGEDVTLKTRASTALITGTLIDQEPLVIYKIDKVLLPRELFKADPTEKTPKAPAPKAAHHKIVAADSPDSSDSPDSEPADQTADDDNAGSRLYGGGRLLGVILSLCVGTMFV